MKRAAFALAFALTAAQAQAAAKDQFKFEPERGPQIASLRSSRLLMAQSVKAASLPLWALLDIKCAAPLVNSGCGGGTSSISVGTTPNNCGTAGGVFFNNGGFVNCDADIAFVTDTLTVTKIGATTFVGAITAGNFNNILNQGGGRTTLGGGGGTVTLDSAANAANAAVKVYRGSAGFGISSTSSDTAADAFLGSPVAATWQLGATDVNGTPVNQTLRSQGAITGNDLPGGNLTIHNGPGTGLGAGSQVSVSRAIMKATGATAQTLSHALIACESKTLSNTSATATAIANFTLPNNSSGAARATISVQCNDGTNFDSDIVTSYVAFVNKAGTLTFGTPVTTASAAANNSGSCTIAPTWVANGTTSVDLKVTPVITTIVPTTTTAAVNIENFGGINAGAGGVVTCK